jgi:AMMECR1 domain-containing protein
MALSARHHGNRRLLCALLAAGALSLLSAAPSAGPLDGRALVSLARAAVESEVRGTPPPRLATKSPPKPVFVTVERKGRVLGCRGALECRTRSLEEEVVLTARAAASHDPRYRPLTPRDLADFQVTVTVIARLEPLDRVDSLPPADGLVLRAGDRTGVVLPWEGKDPHIRLEWAYRKAGVAVGTACTLFRMKAERTRG